MYTMGIDVGSASSKVVILEDGKEIVAAEVIQVGTGSTGPKRALEQALSKSGLELEDMAKIVATGYGRFASEEADKQISEISCHAKGIFFLVPTARTIIDIGGQDAKAIRLDNRGGVKQFFMNDKCAAGTGRFLDVMSRVLEVELSEMAEYDSRATEPATVSSTCTVFAESEVISQLSKGVAKENIIAGVHQSVASKACGLAYRGGIEDDVVMCGGVAQNEGVVRAISKELKRPVIVAPNPQITGALGAALFAYQEAKKES
ncbi:acyl-CoA dehydratase activase [Clostridium aestuarii]|uniref:Acyl-CoA dehydratase activase n=2 Tax=Clostridium aestuarii TaxID=338193 RepID=A0ABT4D1A6_9CLOT|nr:acyl-CoA dehydratase activase [Clostridium aestuarii]MCY6485023.1 acyl-CoA dehydratase activase [Clostridium aestuarii]